MADVVIVGAARTPIGSFQGSLSTVAAPVLGGIAIRAALERARVLPEAVGETYMGCVLPAGLGQAPARQAAHAAGLPWSAGAVTVNKVCGSGLKAVVFGANAIANGEHSVVVAGGMEAMSRAPYLLPEARTGYRMGHGEIVDSMVNDGLWDAYGNNHMGNCAELCSREYELGRELQDGYAAESYRRAQSAVRDGSFRREIVPVSVAKGRGETVEVVDDEEPMRGDPGKLPGLRAAFQKDGVVTAGNASTISDGGAALVLMDADEAARQGREPLARIAGFATHSQAPEWFTTAPAAAIQKLLSKLDWSANDVDLWEINEAFAVVSLVNNLLLDLDPANVNIHGGAIALGHPIGASGARILVTLLHALEDTGGHRGIASLCIGGGEGIALAIER